MEQPKSPDLDLMLLWRQESPKAPAAPASSARPADHSLVQWVPAAALGAEIRVVGLGAGSGDEDTKTTTDTTTTMHNTNTIAAITTTLIAASRASTCSSPGRS